MQANGCSDHNGTTGGGRRSISNSPEISGSSSNGAVLSNGNNKEHDLNILSKTDQDIVRLIGQHLRGLGFK